MSYLGARAALVLSCILLPACGARILDFSASDGGTGDSGTTTGSGGSAGGGAGAGGANPDGGPAGPYVTTSFRGTRASKIDLLFMIDNSSSMSEKQAILAGAVPKLVDQLINPGCIDPLTGRIVAQPVNGVCAVGELAFDPVRDIHIGIISSSLGNHGASGVCEDNIDVSLGRSDPHNDDRAHLLTRGSGGVNVPTWNGKGFLFYNPNVPGGLATSSSVATPFTDMVKGVGQHGCGYEASLEAVYRFLINPNPYDTIRIDTSIGGFGQALLQGTDQALLQQRADFLRPDSLVSVVLVTDENDCSIVDGGQGFYSLIPPVPGTGRSALKHGTSKCQDNPNDPCCFNCGVQSPPAGCSSPDGDPECIKGEILTSEDQPNLRCFNQKRRYGVDFLYPVQRYIDGFTQSQIPNRQGSLVDNPLFSDLTCLSGAACTPPRDKRLVVVAGVVGVPWQDIAVDPGDLTKGYKPAKQLAKDGVWADIVGDPLNPGGPVAPRDPHLVESITPRNTLAGPGSGPSADTKNGHEWDPSKDPAQPNADLQYACIFNLNPPRVCTEPADCDCFGPNLTDTQNPLCQNAQGAYTNTQVRGKAYPAPRILQVLQGLGDQAVTGSICPAQVTDATREDFGYAPAINAVINRLRPPLRNHCMPIALPVDTTSGQTPCSVIEVFTDPKCNCDTEPGRRAVADALLNEEMKAAGTCRCEIKQLVGDEQTICRTLLNPPLSGDGWCYADPAQVGACDAVLSCPADEKRLIRFTNVNSEPRAGATTFLRCEAPPIAPLPSICP